MADRKIRATKSAPETPDPPFRPGGLFISRDEMSPEQALAFDLGHAAATEQAKKRVAELVERLEQAERALRQAKPWIGVEEDHRGRWCPPEVKEDVREALAAQQREQE